MPHDLSPHDLSNVIRLPLKSNKTETAQTEQANSEEQASQLEVQAIASCLDYLHSEARKLGKTMTAHLIGAAAESLRQESGRSGEEVTGHTS
jgi:hypothetical protein